MTAPTRRPPDEATREPIQRPWLWVVIVLSVVVGVPLYLREGTIDPVWFGVPFWLIVVAIAAVVLSATVCLACLRLWSLAEPQETAAEAAERTEGGES